ncbi:amidase, putative [Talaromyces stipitatus ATCC 10500]|uniref:Amidase, putative n=1 Tax=Talaromyces stipitatus (strain ATCC 10500 / CBS 375.48 / QM 6759 / NRRL 1006) TaxID=441959 RepID=B8LXR9_TALSN|nr:amidase, putative [Talaromyces stipitatus ATCC 10500]EED24654.1 amidase, putative [Talaromyces stipitatus ATCC 10500]
MEITQKKLSFDILTTTATDLCRLLEAGQTTTVDIVDAYLAQIERHNKTGLKLRAIISTASREAVLSRAAKLDTERLNGKIRSALHGIPIIIKDAIVTSKALGMPTTAGAFAFKEAYGKRNAPIVELLIQSGLVIIGKASMTEFCGLKATCITAGWSAVNGQTQSAYIVGGFREDDLFCGRSGPGGSSSGSGVGVSAGFAPLSVGTETGGSICMPANRAGLYSMTATLGTVPTDGLFTLSRSFDGLGGMTKSPEDLEMLMNILLSTQARDELPLKWEDISVGFVDPMVWNAFGFQKFRDEGVERQILDEYEWARTQIAQRGAKIAYPVKLPSMNDLRYEEKSVSHSVSFFEFPRQFEKFCVELYDPEVSSVPELVEFNNKNAAHAMPEPHTDQTDLIQTLESTMTDETASAAKAHGKLLAGSQGIDAALTENKIDVIIGPGDCEICAVAALAGSPKAMVPMSRLKGSAGLGQPQGLMIIGGAGSESKMFQFMKLWKEVIGKWKVPPLLETAERVIS